MPILFSGHVTCVTLIGLYKERLGRDAVGTADRNTIQFIFITFLKALYLSFFNKAFCYFFNEVFDYLKN